MEKLELVAAGGISPVRTDPDLVDFVAARSISVSHLFIEKGEAKIGHGGSPFSKNFFFRPEDYSNKLNA